MDALDLHFILEKYNNQLFNSLQNEFMNSFKEDLLKNIKTEIYNLFVNNKKTENTTICGFKRTRERGYCKRTVKGFVCPYHLKQIKNNCKFSALPDEKPDEELYGKHVFTNIKEDYIDIEKKVINKKLLSNIKIYDYSKNNLPKLKKENKIYNCIIYNKHIKIIDKYESNGYSKIKLIEYNIMGPVLGSKNKNKRKNKNIKVEFIKDTKGKMYARNPFPDGFIIDNKYSCKCYIPVEYNGIDKIKLFLVNPNNKKDSKIDIIEISELEDLMLTAYTEETVNKYFNK